MKLVGNQVPYGAPRGEYHGRDAERPAQTLTSQMATLAVWSETGSRNNAVRVTTEEAAALQSYPPGFEFVGTKGKVGLQIGNAVPPFVADAVLSHLWSE